MNFKLEYQVLIKLTFSDEEFELLTMAVKKLKDPRQAIGPGKFWQQNMERRQKNKEDPSAVSASIGQVESILLKSLEPFILYSSQNKEHRKLARSVYNDLEAAATEAFEDLELLKESV